MLYKADPTPLDIGKAPLVFQMPWAGGGYKKFLEGSVRTQGAASPLPGNTGVPGKFEIVFSWLVADAADIEKRIHLELVSHRRAGEFFEMTPTIAKSAVAKALKQWGVIGADGLSFEGRKIKNQEQEKERELNNRKRVEQDVHDFKMAMREISNTLELMERNAGAEAYAATELKGFLSIFKSSDTPERKAAIRSAIEAVRQSLSRELGLSALFVRPKSPVTISEDLFFSSDAGKIRLRSSSDYLDLDSLLHLMSSRIISVSLGEVRRLPKGTTISSSFGWRFNGSRLINISSGEALRWVDIFSNKFGPQGRHFSDESNLGAFHCESLQIFVGEIPGEIP
jgi:hypothetical protein